MAREKAVKKDSNKKNNNKKAVFFECDRISKSICPLYKAVEYR